MTLKRKLVIVLTLFISGCLTPDDIYLEDAEKNARIQKIATDEMKKLQPILDEGCDADFDKLVHRAVDSLVNVYLDSTKYEY